MSAPTTPRRPARAAALRGISLLLAWSLAACGGGSPEVHEGAARLERLDLRPTGPLPPDAPVLVRSLTPPLGLAPWRTDPERTAGKPVGQVPLTKNRDAGATRPKKLAVWLEGEVGSSKRVVVPGPFDAATFNRVEVQLTHYGNQPESTRVVLLREGKPLVASEWLAVPASGPPPVDVDFEFPELRRMPGPVDEIAVETRGAIKTTALFEVRLLQVPAVALLPRPGAPEPVGIGDEDRDVVGLASDLPLEAEVRVPPESELFFSYGVAEALRLPGQNVELEVTVTPEGAASPTLRERYALESRLRDQPTWHEARLPLSALAGQRVRVRYALVADGNATAYALVGEAQVSRRGADAPTVLLVTSDTHRADHLGTDTGLVQTPHLDALAARGVLFTDAFSSTNVTNPSHVAVMTGITPRDTRILNNNTPLANRATTVAEVFRAAGYRTFAVVSAFHLMHVESGLGQGFDRMNGPRKEERTGEESLDVLRALLDHAAGEPVFVWLHLFDAHAPYGPPRPFSGRYWDDGNPYDEDRPLNMPPIKEIPGFLRGLRDSDFPYEQYRAEVDYVDWVMGQVLEIPRVSSGILAFTADHGESFGEHGIWWDHADLFPETIHVPMILAWPGGPEGVRIEEPVEQIDVSRTLLELANVDPQSFPGRSLLWALQRPEESKPRFQLSAHGNTASVDSGRWQLKLHLRDHQEWALEEPRHAHQVELYDLETDPRCLQDLARDPEHFETAQRLRERLIEWLADAPAEGLSTARIQSASAREQLQELGYTGEETSTAGTLYTEDPEDDWCKYFHGG